MASSCDVARPDRVVLSCRKGNVSSPIDFPLETKKVSSCIYVIQMYEKWRILSANEDSLNNTSSWLSFLIQSTRYTHIRFPQSKNDHNSLIADCRSPLWFLKLYSLTKRPAQNSITWFGASSVQTFCRTQQKFSCFCNSIIINHFKFRISPPLTVVSSLILTNWLLHSVAMSSWPLRPIWLFVSTQIFCRVNSDNQLVGWFMRKSNVLFFNLRTEIG